MRTPWKITTSAEWSAAKALLHRLLVLLPKAITLLITKLNPDLMCQGKSRLVNNLLK